MSTVQPNVFGHPLDNWSDELRFACPDTFGVEDDGPALSLLVPCVHAAPSLMSPAECSTISFTSSRLARLNELHWTCRRSWSRVVWALWRMVGGWVRRWVYVLGTGVWVYVCVYLVVWEDAGSASYRNSGTGWKSEWNTGMRRVNDRGVTSGHVWGMEGRPGDPAVCLSHNGERISRCCRATRYFISNSFYTTKRLLCVDCSDRVYPERAPMNVYHVIKWFQMIQNGYRQVM